MPTTKIVTRICLGCGKVETGPTRYLINKYCSKECWRQHAAGQHLKTGETVACDHCGKKHYRRGAYVNRYSHSYCSHECRYAAKAVSMKICGVCDGEFRPHRAAQRYCSHRCCKTKELNPNWDGGRDYRPVNPKEWTKAVYERDDYTCQKCGQRGGKLNAHHILPYSLYPDERENVSNGLTLCVSCHQEEHKSRPWRRSENSSEHKGVSWHKASSKWQSTITIKGQRHYLGLFVSEEDAAFTYSQRAEELREIEGD